MARTAAGGPQLRPRSRRLRSRLEELRLAALEERLEADLALGRHAEVVAELEALSAEHPLRERLRGQLMLALYRAGRQAEALAAYQRARRALVDELGIEPGRAAAGARAAILRQDPALDLAARRDRAAPGARTALRRPRARAGRDAPARSRQHWAAGRLVLIAGEPGIGKSRLAEELARPRPGPRRAGPRRPLLGGRRRARLLAVGAGAARCICARPALTPCWRSAGAGAAELAQILPELREPSRTCPRGCARGGGRAVPAVRGRGGASCEGRVGAAAGARPGRPARR